MSTSTSVLSAWQLLRNREITCQEALENLVDQRGILNLKLLDKEVAYRFFREFPDQKDLPPVIPLLLWRNCYYLASPIDICADEMKKMSDRTFSDIRIIAIAEKSYSAWFHREKIDPKSISGTQLINPLTGELEEEDVCATTELYLSQAADQIGRIKTIISGALRNRASDIHLEPTGEGLRVRYRIDGILRNITTLPADIGRRVVVAIKVMCDMDIAESRCPQDGRISEQYAENDDSNVGLDLRVSTLPCVGGEKVVIRLLTSKNPFSSLEKLGFSERSLNVYKNLLRQPQGMIIFTGPTGSGKTSTLYTSLLSVATENVNVVTVEDPVEYVLPGITQTQVNEKAGMTFAAGLRAILRQDPDIIMMGEIRDRETADTAVRAALTGHLVLTTLHTNDAMGAIPRLKDIGPDPALMSDALLGIVAQRLVRKICPHCGEPHTPTKEELQILGLDKPQTLSAVNWAVSNTTSAYASILNNSNGNGNGHSVQTMTAVTPSINYEIQGKWRMGRGCSNCFNSGYSGREALVELLDVNDTVRELIYEGTMTQLQRYLKKNGFVSFRTAAIEKVTQGITTVEEVQRVLPRSALYTQNMG
ncbi:general secretion pathway protein GspE [Hydrocoleum sp. CS-953]|uniref:GspE/PulE family protein n=1 Tax=Hydrocoleum sp. CS-953 TaxID=1671698 RepID=UPI000B9A4347|nr:GspE/PulE family protein [Hydrocoleum sp. CS-953]OZH53558.1 general secretion pathway protein GspE [Hydrocoleum sp. CS-953]